MSPPRRSLLALAIVAAASSAAGCGGKEQVTAGQLEQKGDAICREEQGKFDQIQAHPPANASIAADQTKELIDVAGAATSDLRHLQPPESMSTPYELYLEARDRAVDQMRRGEDAAGNQDSAGYAAAQNAVAATAPHRRRLADALGLRACSANPRGA